MNVVPAAMLTGRNGLATGAPAGLALATLAVGVRPEAVRIAAAGLPARVIAAEYLGADTQVETRLGKETVMVQVPGRVAAAPGDTIHLDWAPGDAHWFHASSQRRIVT
jgi:sn-glycerol 3-phosphate transport system ATP-binding protein